MLGVDDAPEVEKEQELLRERNQARYLGRQWMRLALAYAPDPQADWLQRLIEEAKATDWLHPEEK
jgi:hypothetical protein